MYFQNHTEQKLMYSTVFERWHRLTSAIFSYNERSMTKYVLNLCKFILRNIKTKWDLTEFSLDHLIHNRIILWKKRHENSSESYSDIGNCVYSHAMCKMLQWCCIVLFTTLPIDAEENTYGLWACIIPSVLTFYSMWCKNST